MRYGVNVLDEISDLFIALFLSISAAYGYWNIVSAEVTLTQGFSLIGSSIIFAVNIIATLFWLQNRSQDFSDQTEEIELSTIGVKTKD